ncbi:MAG: S-methyl-5'-thioadenosine phosphorylase, partial [Actinomycetota bacterium]
REAEICYATMALATDYDCWYKGEEDVTIAQVIEYMNKNVDMAKKIVETVVPRIPEERTCGCANALENSIMTAPDLIPAGTKEKLADVIGKYVE